MSQTNSDGFAELVRANRETRNAALLRATTELYSLDADHTVEQNHRFEELATHLLPEAGVADRRFVAEQLAGIADAPSAVLRMLARDVIEVAEPVILRSPALESFDLLCTIAATDVHHHALIARRPGLPPDVRRALGLAADAAGKTETVPGESSVDGAPEDIASLATAVDDDDGAAPRDEGEPALLADASPAAWHFLGLGREDRLRQVAELSSRPVIGQPDGFEGTGDAFERLVSTAKVIGCARGRQTSEMIAAIARALALSPQFVAASINDPSGEPLAILLKALRLDESTAQMVFLLMSPVGRNVQSFFPLADFYAGMEPVVAESIVFEWRDEAGVEAQVPARPPRHEQIMPEVAARRSARIYERPALPGSLSDRARRA